MNAMARFFSRIKTYVSAHKIISALALAVVLGSAWWLWGRALPASAATRYVVGEVGRGTVVASVSASGQISASSQVDLKPKASGDIAYVGVKPGQQVKAGQLLVRLDSGDAAYELESAQLSYDKLVTIDPEDLRNAQLAVTDAQDSQASAYVSARAGIIKASTDMQSAVESIDTLFGNGGYLASQNGLSQGESASRKQAQSAWYTADSLVSDLVRAVRALPANASQAQVDAVLVQSYAAASSVAVAAKDAQDAVVLLRNQGDDNNPAADSAYSAVTGYVSTANGIVSTLFSLQGSITSAKHALDKAQASLQNLEAGPDEIDRRSQALAVKQKQEALGDYSVYAPFDGIVASVDAKVGGQGSSGAAVATLITKSQVAEISLNEVDAAKVKAGQKATLTFDAIDGLTLTGTVAEVDAIGTVNQGVVSYSVEIALDSQDDRIKPGMTVNASIQTDSAVDALIVPSSAVKTSQGQSYVLAFETPLATSSISSAGVESKETPVQIPVEVGISDDTSVEILSGLTEGEQIITRTIAAQNASTGSATTRAAGTTGMRAGGFGGSVPGGAALRAL
jgi:RND family efflux transporter MFP subunit